MDKLRIFVDLAPAPEILELLQVGTAGHELLVSKTPVTSVLSKAERDPQLATADIAFGQPEPDTVAEAKHLKWIHISSSGITRYDNPSFRGFVTKWKIVVTNSASVFNEACAVHALSFMAAQARQLPRALDSQVANGTKDWHQLRGSCGTLRGETVLILGYGHIGRRLAELLHPFGMKILAYRRNPRGDEGVPVITEPQLADALAKADHVVNILPDSTETRHFFDAKRLGMLKPRAVFYNIGRGTTTEPNALREALRSGRIGAAWLDVTDPEPLPEDHPLRKEPNCFITPHIAGGHAGEAKTLVCHFLQNFDRFLRGEPLLDRIM